MAYQLPANNNANPEGGRVSQKKLDQHVKELMIQHVPAANLAIAKALSSKYQYLEAAKYVLDHVYGKPRQQVEVSGKDGSPLAAFILVAPRNLEIVEGEIVNGEINNPAPTSPPEAAISVGYKSD